MSTYYKDDLIELYQGDALKVMFFLFEKGIVFDAIITDPPYGVTQNKKDMGIPFDKMWDLIKRIRKDSTPIVLFGQGLYFCKLCLSNEKEFRYDWVWNKELTSGFLNAKKMTLRQHEHIAVFYKKPCIYNPQMWKGAPLYSKGKKYKGKVIKNQNYGKFNHTDDSRVNSTLKYPRSIIAFQKPHPSKAIHPTEKPVELMEYLIKTYTKENDLVLDFVCGSGTTLVACKKLNRRCIGIEIDENYCEIVKKRLLSLK